MSEQEQPSSANGPKGPDPFNDVKRLGIVVVGLFGASILFYLIAALSIASSDQHSDSDTASNIPTLTSAGQMMSDGAFKNFADIQIAARVMPSQNTVGNKQLMHAKSDASSAQSFYADGIADDVTSDRFELSEWENYFPNLHFDENYVPLGSAKPYCLHLEWIRHDQANQLNRYVHMSNFPTCDGAKLVGKRWQENDPKTGVDFKVFKQYVKDVTTEDAAKAKEEGTEVCDPNSIFKPRKNKKAKGSGICYRYEILDSVCVRVAYNEHSGLSTYSWDFVDGCFEDGAIAHYRPAVVGEELNFDHIPIEVRQTYTLPAVTQTLAASGEDDGADAAAAPEVVAQTGGNLVASTFSLLGHLCLVGAILSGIYVGVIYHQSTKRGKAKHSQLEDEQ